MDVFFSLIYLRPLQNNHIGIPRNNCNESNRQKVLFLQIGVEGVDIVTYLPLKTVRIQILFSLNFDLRWHRNSKLFNSKNTHCPLSHLCVQFNFNLSDLDFEMSINSAVRIWMSRQHVRRPAWKLDKWRLNYY